MRPPTDWPRLAKNHLANRAWSSVANTWGNAAIGFDISQVQDLSELLDPILGPGFEDRDNVSVFNFPGRYVAAFMDVSAATIKAAYILRTAGNCVLAGQPTWAAIDAYHFSFVAARALLALLGVHLIQINDSYAVLDVFPEGETERTKKQFKRDYPQLTDPSRLILRTRSSIIEQRAIWVILVRMLKSTTFDPGMQVTIDRIIELGHGFSSTRNDVLYRNKAWLYSEDFIAPGSPTSINDDPFLLATKDNFFDERDSSFAFAMLMLKVVRSLVEYVEAQTGSNIIPTSYGDCFRRFSGFDLPKLHSVFSLIYRQESYGAVL